MKFLVVMLILIVAVLIYLVVIIFFPVLKVKKQPVNKGKINTFVPDCRSDISFTVKGSKVSGFFYQAKGMNKDTCIILNNGFCGTKDMVLEKYALRFVEKGFSCLSFDYRFFGDSEGLPRQLYCIPYQLEDLDGAIEFLKNDSRISNDKIIIWGTSSGGPYGLFAASKNPSIKAVISQCGNYDHKEDSKVFMKSVGIGYFFKMLVHAQRDKGRSRFGLSTHSYAAYGKPGTMAMFTSPGVHEGIEKLSRGSKNFINETLARMPFVPHAEDLLELAPNIKCPVHLTVCQKDTIVSPKSHVRLVESLTVKPVVEEYNVGHFEIYEDTYFEQVTKSQVQFIHSIINKD